jgi:DNA adenine methylase
MSNPKITHLQWGGKTHLSKWITSHFPEHRVYVEPFAGSCAVLFAKPPSFIEIVNDLDDRIVNMYEQIRSRPEELAALLWATPYSKANWRAGRTSDDKLEDARLLMSQKQFYCGDTKTSTWAMDKCGRPHKPAPSVFADWFLRILPAAARLKDVQILNEDAVITIERVYQRPETLIYVDPPYIGHESEYQFSVDYRRLVDVLRAATAKVIVSEYAAADEFFTGWHRIEKTTARRAQIGAHKTSGQKKTEVLYMNFEPAAEAAA